MSELKNHYGKNTSLLCHEGSLALNEAADIDGYVASDFDVECDNGYVNVHTITLLESAHVVMEEQSTQLEQLTKERDELKAMLSKFIPSNDYEVKDEDGECEWVEINHGGTFLYDEGSEQIGLEVVELLAKLNQ